jgi:hypothetical protein
MLVIGHRLVHPFVDHPVLAHVAGRVSDADCQTASARATPAQAAATCERAYLRTGEPATAVRLADAQHRLGNHAVAGAIARGLLGTTARADALRVMGLVAAARHQPERARRALEAARALHHTEHRHAAAAEDDRALAALAAASRSAPALSVESQEQI